MQCSFCNSKEATCHLTKVVNGKAVEVHVCSTCIPEIEHDDLVDFDIWDAVSKLADKIGVPDPGKVIEPEPLQEISAKSFLLEESGRETPCPVCGFTAEHLRKTGRLGCSNCYEAFREMLQDVLSDCQKGDSHTGKTPKSMIKYRQMNLQAALDEAVREERFEEAAELRDQLKSLVEAPS